MGSKYYRFDSYSLLKKYIYIYTKQPDLSLSFDPSSTETGVWCLRCPVWFGVNGTCLSRRKGQIRQDMDE